MSEKLISVIVPVYNVEKYLKKSIDSLLNQTYKNLEVILVDDGGKDECPAICDVYKEKDKRVRVIHKENGGLSDARNAGLAVAQGEYIAFIDSDDYLKPNMYEILAKAMETVGADIAVCNFETVTQEGTPIAERNIHQIIRDEVITGKEAICRLCGSNYEYYVTAWNRLYRKDIVKDISFPKGKIHEDEFTAHLFYGAADKIACVKEALYCYVVREDSIMTRKYGKRNLDYFEALENRIQYCIEHDIDAVVIPFTNWMLKDLSLVYGKLNFAEEDCEKKYEECVERYFRVLSNVKCKYPISMKNRVLSLALKISPKIANKLVKLS